MPSILPVIQVRLHFKSLESISAFKHECACGDFYIDRDELTLVGSFTEEQVAIALGKYDAVSVLMVEEK